jgi:hypothetical protein
MNGRAIEKIIIRLIIICALLNIIYSIFSDLEYVNFPPVATSPSGSFEYRIQEEDTYVLVGIYDDAGELLFLDDEKYYKRFAFIVEWQEDDDVLWIYSGDIGDYCLIHKNNKWQKVLRNSEYIVGKPPKRIAKKLSSYRN